MKDDEWNKVINLNLTSSFLLSKFAIKKMSQTYIFLDFFIHYLA
jgi:NAD(P)-dependent dehydrogenase (short-subunit alcohol dehydrogenase family)